MKIREIIDSGLSVELISRSKNDQEMRRKAAEDQSAWDDSIDRENTVYLKELVEQRGWPTISAVGPEASQAAWLLVQHADHEPAFQEHCLTLMKGLPKGEVSLPNIAYLEDRVRVGQGRPQLYGTQFFGAGTICSI